MRGKVTVISIISLNFVAISVLGREAQNQNRSSSETYSATESVATAGLAPTGTQVPLPMTHSSDSQSAPQGAIYPQIQSKPGTQPVDLNKLLQVSSYDAVPMEQVEPILKRLKIVSEIVEKYGRAYNYKTLTLRELQMIRSRLEEDALAHENKSNHIAPAVPGLPIESSP